MRTLPTAAVLFLLACVPAHPGTSTGESRFRQLYKELVETNTSLSAGSCTLAQILAPVRKLSAQFWPGLPVLPLLVQGASDGRYLNAAGIPTYGISGLFAGPDVGNVHGLNEYVGVQTFMECRDFLYRLVKIYAEQK
jgi:acetylornithine deacetylase/succinyl-diaminopimelate desuccinylase-like protein